MPATILMIRHMTDETGDHAARTLAEAGFRLEHRRSDRDGLPADLAPYAAVVVYGGPHAVEDADYVARELGWVERWVAADKPYVGFCLGAQLLARALGARVGPPASGLHEYGFRLIEPTTAGLAILPASQHMLEAHYHGISGLPASAPVLARGADYPVQAFQHGPTRFGFQFHPEATAAIYADWLARDAAGERQHRLGVDPIDRRRADALRYIEPMNCWLGEFLAGWAKSFGVATDDAARPQRRRA